MDLNNRRTGKYATKPRALGLLGHSGGLRSYNLPFYYGILKIYECVFVLHIIIDNEIEHLQRSIDSFIKKDIILWNIFFRFDVDSPWL